MNVWSSVLRIGHLNGIGSVEAVHSDTYMTEYQIIREILWYVLLPSITRVEITLLYIWRNTIDCFTSCSHPHFYPIEIFSNFVFCIVPHPHLLMGSGRVTTLILSIWMKELIIDANILYNRMISGASSTYLFSFNEETQGFDIKSGVNLTHTTKVSA